MANKQAFWTVIIIIIIIVIIIYYYCYKNLSMHHWPLGLPGILHYHAGATILPRLPQGLVQLLHTTSSQGTSWSPEVRQKASRWIDAKGWQMYYLGRHRHWHPGRVVSICHVINHSSCRSRPEGAEIPAVGSHPCTLSIRWICNARIHQFKRQTFLTNLVDVYQLAPATCEKLRSYFKACRWQFSV